MARFYCKAHGKYEVVRLIEVGETIQVSPFFDSSVYCGFVFANLDARCEREAKMRISVIRRTD